MFNFFDMKLLLFSTVFFASVHLSYSQKMGYVDTEYILKNIPSYREAQEQLNTLAAQWQKEIEDRYDEISQIRSQYEIEKLLLTDDMRNRREQEIARKERDARDLQRKRFGAEGDRYRRELELMKPIQEEVFAAIRDIAGTGNYGMIIDAASSSLVMVFTDPRYDLSEDVLKKLGYIK
jgi:outer membrane protein